ncbi:Synaptotagmin-4 [Citrus sinensis]|uniref:Synaptotagmin-4 n=1 Tax=Citrus sinensis TaxID=2711 RepID=A0ACB8NLP8_CITSI|nr:Synaptotagmin-4 [Citrus sinensis]KAH9799021.1 Synaptotagmin-4 [Citrus sinensis]
MSFLYGMFFGISFGIGLMVAYARYENVRSRRRAELANIVAAFSRMTVQDSRKLIPPEFYPPWVVFQQRQKAASELIRSNVEPILEQYRPSILASLSFSKLTLGTVAPQFTGVAIVESESGEEGITMELEMQWDGNPNIVLDIRTRVGVGLPVQVKNIGFTGVFRLIFKPLVDEFPCFGAVAYSLREKKDLDFTLKVVGGDISSIPGISDAIEETIIDAIEDSITWPVRQIIPILPGDYSDLELKPCGTLDVKLVQAKELTNKDLIGKSDPFVVIFNNELNPIWNEHFEFTVEDASTQHLTVRVFDDEGPMLAPEIIGIAQIALKELEPGKVKDVWLKLVKDVKVQRDTKNRGQVHLELLYCPFGTESSLKNPFNSDYSLTTLEKSLKSETSRAEAAELGKIATQKKSDVIVRGVLSITVIAAENLPKVDLIGKADPFVVLQLKKAGNRAKTRVAHDTLNPVWNQTFDFVVEDGQHEMLILDVYDHDTFGKDKMGKCIMTLTRVMMEGEIQDSFHIDGTKSGKLFLNLKWTPQLVLRDSS